MERSRVSTFIFIGCSIGNAVALAASGALCDSNFLGGWPSTFYVFGAIGCIWFLFWTWLVHESPETHPKISKEELQYILKNQDRDQKKSPIPWCNLLTSVPMWALSFTHMCQAWGAYTLQIELPNYLSNILHFDLKNNGIISSLPQVLNTLGSILASILADKMRINGCLKITAIRKLFNSIAFFGGAACFLIVPFAGCQSTLIVILLTLSMGIMGATNSGFEVAHVDMSPELAGTLYGITNCWASICGSLTSVYVGWIMQDGQTVERWNVIFFTSAAVFVAGGAIFNILGSSELQTWKKKKTSDKSQKDCPVHPREISISGAGERELHL